MFLVARHRAFLYILLGMAAVSAQQQSPEEENCGLEWGRSATEINGCNIKLEEEFSCSFKSDGNVSMVPALEDDKRTVDIQYQACKHLSEEAKECSNVTTYVAYGHAVFLMDGNLDGDVMDDGILVQRQSGSTGSTMTDRVCLLYDHNDGKSPTVDCRADCLEIADNLGKEIVLGASEANGLPSYGSVTWSRHVKILKTGTRSAAASSFGPWLLTTLVSSFGMMILNI